MANFVCLNCGRKIDSKAPGTQHRNHCPGCLWSKHVDDKIPGDRLSQCQGAMEPVGLAYKSEGGHKQGELCIVHRCQACSTISKNRLAGDDQPQSILDLYYRSVNHPASGATVLAASDEREIITQLFGRAHADEVFRLRSSPGRAAVS